MSYASEAFRDSLPAEVDAALVEFPWAMLVGALIRLGVLVPVEVFGTLGCCVPEHMGDDVDCGSKGYGLCDRFSAHAPGGSDCNRATSVLLRPSDDAMASAEVQAAFAEVLTD